jgi:DNA polymerase-3 subunit delta'
MSSVSWPESLAGTPAVVVIEHALERDRLAHGLLLHGDDLDTLVLVAHAIADRLLNEPDERSSPRRLVAAERSDGGSLGEGGPAAGSPTTRRFPPEQHPDCFTLRPSGKMRFIRIGKADGPEPGTMREFLRKLSVSPALATRKVGIIYEADRMNVETSNAFLKTLEEPPGRTTLLLLTTRPYALLPTIRSRCLHFRFPALSTEALAEIDEATRQAWRQWKTDYQAWLTRLTEGVTDRAAVAGQVFGLYGLVARFNATLAGATDKIWQTQKAKLPPDLDEDEQVAVETGIANGIRQKLFSEIEQATLAFARPRLAAGDGAVRGALAGAVGELERCAGLFRVNLHESAALEQFLLTSLRLWSKRPS